MTHIQQVLFEMTAPYAGHPYFVTGHALYNAIAHRVDERTRRVLCASHGVFVPCEYGEYPPAHSQDGYAGKLGGELPPVESYQDLFLYRDVAQRWLLDSRPRDAHNVHPLETHGGRPAFASECWIGRPAAQRNHRRSVRWFVQCYVHTTDAAESPPDVLPLADSVLDGLRVGGQRNYGFGELSVVDTQLVDVEALSYESLTDHDGSCRLELVTPFVIATDHPHGDDQDVPWWWGPKPGPGASTTQTPSTAADPGLRRRSTRLVTDGTAHRVETIDHGQVCTYAGSDPAATAKNGVLRVGTHSRFGFGEVRLRPPEADRVPARRAADQQREQTISQGGESGWR